jgi:cytoplasmic tRNA 2-thiolation protein 1
MAPKSCALCQNAKAILRRPKTGQQICKECFFKVFETEVHNTITESRLFKSGDRVAIGASGGKGGCVYSCFLAICKPNICADSTVLAYVMKTLNERYQYGLNLYLLSIDEGITGYRDDSLEVSPYLPYVLQPNVTCDLPQTVKRNQQQYDMPLKILSYHELYGWTMDRVVSTIGKKNNCTFCGVFRRQALDRGAATLGVDHIVTGHNADDIAETVLMNSTSFTSPLKTDGRPHIRGQSCEATLRGSVDVRRSAHREKTR